MSEYWERHLKKHCQNDMDKISASYPKERVIHINIGEVKHMETRDETLRNPGGQSDHIKDALAVLLPKRDDDYKRVIVRYHNVEQKRKIKDLRSSDEKKLIAIKSIISIVSEVRPKVIRATYQCAANHLTTVESRNELNLEPRECPSPGCRLRPEHLDSRDVKIDRQWISIQDPLEEMNEGGQPHLLKCEIVEDLCGTIFPGDRVIVNGQYRSTPIRKMGNLTASKDVYFDVSSIEIGERDFDNIVITDDDEMKIIELSKSEELFDKLTESVAPSILDMKIMKQAIILQLFEGVTQTLKDGTINRGHINVLVVSDPGMAKTKLLHFVTSIAPRGMFANATTSTKVGLVAPVIKDEITGGFTIRAGPYMLAAGGILCLDEVSELDAEEFKYLNEAMEDGQAHITKGGLNVVVNVRASLLAACNPKAGRFDMNGASFADQVNVPDPTLSRFDIVLYLPDSMDNDKDRRMIEHITKTHMNGQSDSTHISPDLLRKYIAYGRRISPKLTKESKKLIDDYYVSIRTESYERRGVTLRQGTAVIRLSEAHAKMRLSDKVTKEDAEAAIYLFDAALRQLGTDPSTGKLDASRLDHKHKFGLVDTILKVIKNGTDGKASEGEILMETSKHKYESEKVCRTIRDLKNEGKIIEPKNGLYKVM